MKNAKLIHFLRLLPPASLAEFKVYLQCPLFQERQVLSRLMAVLEADCLHGHCEDDKQTRERIYRKVYGERPYQEQTLKTVLSQLLSTLREFMALTQFRKDSFAQQRYFLRHLNAIQEDRYFEGYHDVATKELAQAGLDQAVSCPEHMLLDAERMQYERRQTGKVSKPTLDGAINHIEQGFLTQLLRSQLERYGNGDAQAPSAFAGALLQALDTEAHTMPALVQVYHRLCKAMSAPDVAQEYLAAKALCVQVAPQLSVADHQALRSAFLDFACQRLSDGDPTFAAEVLAAYDQAIASGLFFPDSKMRPQHFRALMVAGLSLGHREWAVALHKQWLGDAQQHADQFARALLAFYSQDYATATRLFHAVLAHTHDPQATIHARLYLLMSHFETNDTQSLECLCHSFRMLLDRNREVSAPSRSRCIAFLNLLRRFMNTPLTDARRMGKLREGLQAEQMHVVVYVWLLAKVGGGGVRRVAGRGEALMVAG